MSLLNRYTLVLILLTLCVVQYFLFTIFFAAVPSENLSFIANNYKESFQQKVKTSLRSTLIKPKISSDVLLKTNSMYTRSSYIVKSSIPIHQHRIAVLLPYIGKSLPAWFDLFAFTAHSSASLIDWFIFITEAPTRDVPSNVHMIRLSRKNMFQRLARLDEGYTNTTLGRTTLESYFQYIVDFHPYILVEIKPALGYLFADYVNDYSHWAYADLDLLMGRAHLHLTPDVLTEYDIVTIAFGDNNRLYMRGQFTLHKNNERVKNLWKKCRYLSHVGERMDAFFVHTQHWDFQSAEGCYSKVVADETNLSVLYLPVQFSDAFPGSLDEKETLLLGSSLLRCYEAPITANIMRHGYDVNPNSMPIDVNVKEIKLSRKAAHCSYWIRSDIQVCTEFVPANATIRIEEGLMRYFIEDRYNIDHCKEASIAHFQGWKREFFFFTARPPSSNAHAMVVSEAGVIPLVLQPSPSINEDYVRVHDYASLYEETEKSMARLKSRKESILPLQEQQQQSSSYLFSGRIHCGDMRRTQVGPTKQQLISNKPRREFATIPRLLRKAADSLAVKTAQVQQTGTEKNQFHNSITEVPVSSYCLRFSHDLKKCELPVSAQDIQIYPSADLVVAPELQYATTTAAAAAAAITLVSVGWMADFHAGRYDELLTQWNGPKILVLARTGQAGSGEPSKYPAPHRSDTTIILVDIRAAGQPAHEQNHQNYNVTFRRLPEKTMFNMGLDAVDSDLVLLVPSHVTLKKQLSPPVAAATTGTEWTADLTAEEVLQSYRHAVASLKGEEDSVTPALVLPLYLAHSQDPGLPLQPYPSHAVVGAAEQCGIEQPPSLVFPPSLTEPRTALGELRHLDFNAQELSLRRTLMLPVLFNASASPHGAGFARFPEELNGVGCHGAFLLRVLAGSGYKLFWTSSISGHVTATTHTNTSFSSFQPTTLVTVVDNSNNSISNSQAEPVAMWRHDCECVSSNSPQQEDPAADAREEAKMRNMIARFNRYFSKAVELRKLGLSHTYSRKKFGGSFERDQLTEHNKH